MKTETMEVRNHGRLGAQVIWLTHDNWISSMPDLKTAELTAAAPELLEALKAMVEVVESRGLQHGAQDIVSAHSQAQSAIAKAEGTKG